MRSAGTRRPVNFGAVPVETGRMLRRYGVRTKKGLNESGTQVVHIAPVWAFILLMEWKAGVISHKAMKYALRRGTRDHDFRDALDAAGLIDMHRKFLAAQMNTYDE